MADPGHRTDHDPFEPYAAVRQTHSGVVLLLGDLAYKMKRPVKFGFLDFTTRAARHAACAREVELNRRFAPDVYLGVGGLRRPDSTQEEPAVVMRRMPDERRLSHLVRTGADEQDLQDVVRDVARQVAAFHSGAHRGPEVDAEGSRDAIRGRWDDSFQQVRGPNEVRLDPGLLAEIEHRVHAFLDGRRVLFDERVAAGQVVDGHGDLLADDVFCLDGGPRILDCLEFDDRLRFVDVLDDIAFLAMDLERLGAPTLADLLLCHYRTLTGDTAPPALLHHFIAYRAFVRAKVSCLQGAAASGSASEQATGYAELAARHLRAGQVRLVLVGGPPGTGKTTLAGDLAERTGYVVISSDRVRKELAGIAAETSARTAFGTGLYDADHTRATYTEMLRRAEVLLARGWSVLLDATWSDPQARQDAVALARASHVPLISLRCTLSERDAASRIRTRTGISDADETLASQVRSQAAPWPDSVPIDTSRPRADCVRSAQDALAEASVFVLGRESGNMTGCAALGGAKRP